MIIDCISDLHGLYPQLVGGDLLVVAGDLTARDTEREHDDFWRWLAYQNYEKKIVIAGNHDGYLEANPDHLKDCGEDIEYLCDSGTEFGGFKIWGSPWTPTFCDWYFMKDRGDPIKEKWDLIPDDTDILITHGPAWGLLDTIFPTTVKLEHLGCCDLRNALDRVKPKLHVFGHIHGSYGQLLYKHEGPNTICVNAAIMNEKYEPVNKPIRIVL